MLTLAVSGLTEANGLPICGFTLNIRSDFPPDVHFPLTFLVANQSGSGEMTTIYQIFKQRLTWSTAERHLSFPP